MGWTTSSSWGSLKSVIADRVQNETNQNGTTFEFIAKCYKGAPFQGTLWSLCKRTQTNGTVRISINCDLIKYFGSKTGFGYKDMDASMHPFRYNCPLKYILTEGLTFDEGDDLLTWIGGVLTNYKKKDSPIYKKALLKFPTAIEKYVAWKVEADKPFVPKKMVTMEEMFPNGIPSLDPK